MNEQRYSDFLWNMSRQKYLYSGSGLKRTREAYWLLGAVWMTD